MKDLNLDQDQLLLDPEAEIEIIKRDQENQDQEADLKSLIYFKLEHFLIKSTITCLDKFILYKIFVLF